MDAMPWSMVNNWVWSFTWHQLCGTDGRRTESAPVEGQNDLEVRSLSDIFGHEPHEPHHELSMEISAAAIIISSIIINYDTAAATTS